MSVSINKKSLLSYFFLFWWLFLDHCLFTEISFLVGTALFHFTVLSLSSVSPFPSICYCQDCFVRVLVRFGMWTARLMVVRKSRTGNGLWIWRRLCHIWYDARWNEFDRSPHNWFFFLFLGLKSRASWKTKVILLLPLFLFSCVSLCCMLISLYFIGVQIF